MPDLSAQMDAVCHRFEELSVRLNQPDAAADPALFRKLMRDYHETQPVVQAYRDWQTARDHLAQAKALLEEPISDPDFKQMIQQEISEKSQDVAKLENNLKILLLPRDPRDEKNVIMEIRGGAGGEEAALFAGRLVCIDLPGLHVQALPATELITSSRLTKFLSARPYTDYKNKRGHIGVIAGSEGMLGAARLCCEAALRAGAGLVTLHVHKDIYPLIAPSMPPEIMVRPVDSYADISIRTFSAFLIGPGIGSVSEEDAEAIRLILETGTPTVLDADGLNLAAAMQWSLGEHVLATPHHGEIRRLLPDADNYAIRADIADCFLAEHEAALIYKGARTIVTQRGKPLFYNITGDPGMATAGQGDVLAGVCGGFISQGESLLVSAVLGVYLCGRASEMAISAGEATQQTLTAGDTLRHLPAAILSTARLCY